MSDIFDLRTKLHCVDSASTLGLQDGHASPVGQQFGLSLVDHEDLLTNLLLQWLKAFTRLQRICVCGYPGRRHDSGFWLRRRSSTGLRFMRHIRIFMALLASIWLAGGSRIAIALTPAPEGALTNGDDWLWLRAIGGGALAVAFLIVLVYLIVVRRPLTTYSVPPKSTGARLRKRAKRPSRANRGSTPGTRNRHT